jgi:hypothetical protein
LCKILYIFVLMLESSYIVRHDIVFHLQTPNPILSSLQFLHSFPARFRLLKHFATL